MVAPRGDRPPLKGLEDSVGISYLHPYRDDRGWALTGDGYTDAVNGFEYLAEAYEATEPGYDGRVSVPVLWDSETARIVSNESHDIMRMFNAAHPEPDLYPAPLRAEIDSINERVYDTVNNGVYRAGFAKTQEAYDEAFEQLFDSLAWLEDILGARRYLAGEEITEADWRLFPTLVRFDPVYHVTSAATAAGSSTTRTSGATRASSISARDRRHRRDGRDQAALLHDARLAEPEAHRPARGRSTPTGPAPHGRG